MLESSSTHSRTLAYDAVGRVQTLTDGLTGAVVTSGYDAEGRRTLVTEGGVDRRYEYDARGQLRRLRMGAGGWLDVAHDALGRRTSVTRPNGVRSDWVYDEGGQLTAVLHTKAGVVVEGFSYTYDSHGLRVSKTRFDGTSESYGYDGSDRLVRVDESSGRSSQYTLDWVGNRTNLVVTQGAQVTSASSVSNAFNQLTSSTRSGGGLPSLGTAYVYDANGNLTTETAGAAATTYTWDADNRLRQVVQPGALHQYEYDANGLRTKKVEAGVETRFLLDGQSVLAEYDSNNTATRRYLQNPEAIDDILEFTEGGQAYFPLTDALGSVVAITDNVGAVVRRNNYEVYGARTSTGSGPEWAFGFTGREHEAGVLRYHRQRYARATTGTWNQADGLGIGTNRFAYGDLRPVMNQDPSGYASSLAEAAWLFPAVVNGLISASLASMIAAGTGTPIGDIPLIFGVNFGFGFLASAPFGGVAATLFAAAMGQATISILTAAIQNASARRNATSCAAMPATSLQYPINWRFVLTEVALATLALTASYLLWTSWVPVEKAYAPFAIGITATYSFYVFDLVISAEAASLAERDIYWTW